MMDFLIYDAKVALLVAVFYMFYRLMLARETFHRVNRIVLLATAVASFVLPLCVLTMHETVTIAAAAPAVTVGDMQIVAEPAAQPDTFQTVLPLLFMIGVVATLSHSLASLFRILMLVRQSEKHPQGDGITICVTGNADVPPFSWMRYIVMNRSDYEERNAAILAHERGHIRLCHSWDVILVDLLTALQWFNPAMWMLRSDLRAIHEYEADGEVLSQGINARQYQYLLITKAASIGGYSLANGISHSTLKNRITMMTNMKSKDSRQLKLLALVPIVGIALALNARTVTDYVYDEPQKQMPIKKGRQTTTIKTGTNQAIQVVAAPAQQAASEKQAASTTQGQGTADTKKVYDMPEEMPQFPGGPRKLFEYLAKNVRYPADAEKAGVQGRVVTTFVVEKDGSIAGAAVVKSIHPSLDAEALRVVSAMLNWIPGKQDGEAVRVKYVVPITFRLQDGPTIPANDETQGEAAVETVAMGIEDKAKASPNNEPYVIVDGSPIDFEKMKDIDPETIESMDVLKEKSAVESYGDKARHGAIIIHIKKK